MAGLLELRQYVMKPAGIKEFMRLTKEKLELRTSLLPFLGMFTCDTGGVLNRVVHLYHYRDFDHRDKHRAMSAANHDWQDGYLAHSRPCLLQQESTIYVPAAGVMDAAGSVPVQQFKAPPREPGRQPLYELRQYQLKPGYEGVPRLLTAFERGIPSKIEADNQGALVFFGYTEVGMLNSVLELWRYPSAQASYEARQAARQVQAWRECIAEVTPGVQHFTSSFMHAVPFSPMQ
ncbi:hypothetical protein N2152v2_003486 [Parachlorella kessleri]